MKKTFVILSAAAMTLIAGCQKENFGSMDSNKTVLSVGINEAKTTLGELDGTKRPIYWANGDVLRANDLTSNALSDVPEKCKSASFTFEGTLIYPANLLYPAAYYKDAQTITLPELQAKTTNVPLYGYAESDAGVQMNALLALIRIPVKQGEDKDVLKSIVVESKTDGYCLSGEFTIDYQTGALTPGAGASAKTGMNFTTQLNPDTAVDFFIAVPAGEGVSLSVKFKDQMGHCMTKTLSNKTFVAGQISALPEIVFAPTTTEFDVVITTAAEWNAFADSFNDGNYDNVSPLVVSINADLDFQGLTNTVVGDYSGHYHGADDHYCQAVIMGNNHKILNLHSGQPLVASVDGAGRMDNLTIDGSCSFEVTTNPDFQLQFGPFTEYLKGGMSNCANYGDITLSGADNIKDNYVGGIAGRIREGQMSDCTNYGSISIESTYTAASKYAYAGGIVGYISNADGKVVGCRNEGQLTTSALAPQVFLGGIAGLSAGTITECTNVGGISASMARPKGDACKHIYMGGIAAKISGGEVSKCSNVAKLNTSSAVKIFYIGGTVADVGGTANLSDNTNSGDITSTGGLRDAFFGGLYGRITAANTITVKGNPFTGKISISGHESATSVYLFAGGIVGLAQKALTITGEECSIEASIKIPIAAATAAEVMLGGVIGGAGENGAGVANADAKLTVSGINVSGDIRITGSGMLIKYKKACFGGIVGGAFCGAEISKCSSGASVYFAEAGTSSGSNGHPSHLGGIAGRIDGGDSSISSCTNSGNIYNYLYNNNNWDIATHDGCCAAGGIVGSFGYALGNTNTCTISNCSSSNNVYGYRGISGGIAGYLNGTTVENCSYSSGKISRGAPSGGIVAAADTCSINGCTATPSSISGNGAGSCVGDGGGIIGAAKGTSVNDCKIYSTISRSGGSTGIYGGIIGCPDADCMIGDKTACSFGGTVNGTTVSESNVASLAAGNALITTPISVTYWNGK